MNRVGPGGLTLAAIAEEAGVTPAVLVQRFGSKRALLLALSEKYADGAGQLVADIASRHSSPLAALRAYADCMSGIAASPAAFARSLAYLQIDLTDADFRKHLVKQAKATRAGVQRLIQAAIHARELVREVDPARLARTIEAVLGGSLLSWAVYRSGSAREWLRADLEAVLAPYVMVSGGTGRGRASTRARAAG
jgi:AcrR family transcriptional regulator